MYILYNNRVDVRGRKSTQARGFGQEAARAEMSLIRAKNIFTSAIINYIIIIIIWEGI